MNNQVLLPWPEPALSPNKRTHWAKLAKAKRGYRYDCYALSRHISFAPGSELNVSIIFWPPDNRVRDLDNMLASIKSGLDGLADAMGVDDSQWSIRISRGHKDSMVDMNRRPELLKCGVGRKSGVEVHVSKKKSRESEANKTFRGYVRAKYTPRKGTT